MTPRWIVHPKSADGRAERLAQAAGVHLSVAEILLRRGVETAEDAQRFLEPRLEHLHDPHLLKGMDAAVERLSRALTTGEAVLVSGDYDVDGITSTSLLTHFLRATAADAQRVDWFIPNRFEHGYGLTPATVEALLQRKPTLVVTVDNGITALEEVRRLHAAGVETIITDHHLPLAEGVPEGIVVNPQQPGCAYPDKRISGCGVAFKLITALRRRLRDDGWWNELRPEPNLRRYLDLVAIATVADVVPLLGENRTLTRHGLAFLNSEPMRPGVAALCAGATRPGDESISARTIGFRIAPRINAAGRMAEGGLAVQLLLSEDPQEVAALAARLEAENEERRSVGDAMYREAVAAVERESSSALATSGAEPAALCVASEGFHEGIIGIVASRLVERYHRPAMVLARNGDGYKGSARSVPGIHITRAIATCAHLLDNYGGHAGAAGCSFRGEHLEAFRTGFVAACAQQAEHAEPLAVYLEDTVCTETLSEQMVEQLALLEPFGQENEEPQFLLEGVRSEPTVLKERHLKWVLASGVEMLAWNRAEGYESGKEYRFRVRLGFNEFRGQRKIQLIADDMATGQTGAQDLP